MRSAKSFTSCLVTRSLSGHSLTHSCIALNGFHILRKKTLLQGANNHGCLTVNNEAYCSQKIGMSCKEIVSENSTEWHQGMIIS